MGTPRGPGAVLPGPSAPSGPHIPEAGLGNTLDRGGGRRGWGGAQPGCVPEVGCMRDLSRSEGRARPSFTQSAPMHRRHMISQWLWGTGRAERSVFSCLAPAV
jgi:hypothetical protein